MNKPILFSSALAAALLVAGCGTSQGPALTAEDQATADQIAAIVAEDPDAEIVVESDEDRIVCRRIRVLGSNIPERVCYNEREVERAAENARQTQRGMATMSTGPRDPMASTRENGP